jgi:hypothetical protein
MNESYDISTGSYLEEEQNEIFHVYFPAGYEPNKDYIENQTFFHEKWISHEFDDIILSASKITTELRAFFLSNEAK